jgi:hypothetical protein
VPASSTQTRIRPLTAALVLAALALVALGIYYLMTPASSLPSFVPGHEAGSTHHHVKHGLAAFGVALVALIGAWFTTAPKRPEV